MTTFSQLVDEMVTEIGRPDMRDALASYLNQTIRECHFDPREGSIVHYASNRVEEQLTADVAEGFVWEYPDPARFQQIEAVRYDSVHFSEDKTRYIEERVPSPGQAGWPHFWYRTGNAIAFSGYGGINALISLSYFQYPKRLKYIATGSRPALYDSDDGWTYAVSVNTPELEAAARAQTSNWMLLRWADVLSEGVRAKAYKRVADEVRARTSYSLYMMLREGLMTAELT